MIKKRMDEVFPTFVFVLHDDLIIAIQLSFEYPLHHDQEIILQV